MNALLHVAMTLAWGFASGLVLVLLGIAICIIIDYRPKDGPGGRGP